MWLPQCTAQYAREISKAVNLLELALCIPDQSQSYPPVPTYIALQAAINSAHQHLTNLTIMLEDARFFYESRGFFGRLFVKFVWGDLGTNMGSRLLRLSHSVSYHASRLAVLAEHPEVKDRIAQGWADTTNRP